MSDKYAADEQLLLNAQEVENQLRHLADNEIDSDSFAVVTENYNGRETDFERPITDLAIDAANLVDALVEALELRDKRILELLAERDADRARIAELAESHSKLRDTLAAIHNTIRMDGGYTPLAAILNASKRAHEESAAAAAGISLKIEGE